MSHKLYQSLVTIGVLGLVSCQTAQTVGKIVDRSRNEIIISSPSDQRSALPEASKDSSLTDAREKLLEDSKNKPKDVTTLLSLAQLQLAQDRFHESEETCQKILRLDIKNQEARKVLAQAAIRQGNYDMAMIFLTALEGEQSRDSSVLNMLGLVSLSLNDSSDAMPLWKKSLTLNANDISVRMNMGVLYLKYRLISQASIQFERILKVAPSHQDAKLHLAIVNASRGQHEQSVVTYKEILSKDKDNPLALYNLAVSEKALAHYEDALDALKSYIKASPGKSAHTDRAFALIEEINSMKQAEGNKLSDEEIHTLASNLEQKKQGGRVDKSNIPQEQKVVTSETKQSKSSAVKTPSKTDADLGADQDIEELEKQLKAH